MAEKKQRWSDIGDIPSGRGDKKSNPSDRLSVYKFPDKKWVTVRLYPGMVTTAGYWVTTKKKDGSRGRFFAPCISFDPETHECDESKADPWRDAAKQLNTYSDDKSKPNEKVISYQRTGWINAIIRAEQSKEPGTLPKHTKAERESGMKDKDSESWTPAYAVRMTKTLVERVQGLKGTNTHHNKKTGETASYQMSDMRYGCDLMIKYDKDAAPASQYDVQKSDRSPLTEEEKAYLLQDLSLLVDEPVSEEEVVKDFESWAKRNEVEIDMPTKSKKSKAQDEDLKKKKGRVVEDEDDEDEDDEDEAPAPKKSSKKPAAKSKKVVDEDDEDDDDLDDEDEDDEPAPKSKAKSKGKKVVEEDDEDEDEDLDDEDEDDEPAPKKKGKPVAAKSKGKSKIAASEEDDEDEEDEDDEDEEPAPKKGKKVAAPVKGKKKPVVEEDEDDDLDDDEEDEDEPAPKAKGKKPAPAAKGKKKVVEEDEDEDEDLDDEDEEEDEPAPKKKVAAKGKKVAVEEDDEDDDLDDDEDEEEEPAPKKKAKKR